MQLYFVNLFYSFVFQNLYSIEFLVTKSVENSCPVTLQHGWVTRWSQNVHKMHLTTKTCHLKRAYQGLQNYRHLKMTIPIPILAEYDTDTDTNINAGPYANHSANLWRRWKLSNVLLFRKHLGPTRLAGYAANKCFTFIRKNSASYWS